MTIKRKNHGRNHSYWDVAEDGTETKVPGVTTILGDAIPKPALPRWAAAEAAGYAIENWDELTRTPAHKRYDAIKAAPWTNLTKAGAKGTEIHEIAEQLLHGNKVEIPDEHAAYVVSCVRFLDDWGAEPVISEATVINRTVGYAGTLDLVARMGNETWLLDWKTGKGVYADSTLQLVAYARAEHYLGEDGEEHHMSSLEIDRAGIVHLRDDGYDVYETDISEVAWLAFRHAAWMGRLLHQEKTEAGYRSGLDDFLLGRRVAS